MCASESEDHNGQLRLKKYALVDSLTPLTGMYSDRGAVITDLGGLRFY